jgi:kinesin family protein 1
MGSPPVNNAFLFNDIGKEILNHIYQGYNSTVFAYGQTGSGKSYSIEGY